MQRIKHTLYIRVIILDFTLSPVNPLSPVINIGPEQIYAATSIVPAKYQTAIINVKNKQTETGSIISEHVNIKKTDTLQ